jgi:polyketide synthase 2
MELRTRLESGLDIKLAANFVWKHPTVVALATGIGEHVGLKLNGEEDSDSGS